MYSTYNTVQLILSELHSGLVKYHVTTNIYTTVQQNSSLTKQSVAYRFTIPASSFFSCSTLQITNGNDLCFVNDVPATRFYIFALGGVHF
jgi:hypothetical protein